MDECLPLRLLYDPFHCLSYITFSLLQVLFDVRSFVSLFLPSRASGVYQTLMLRMLLLVIWSYMCAIVQSLCLEEFLNLLELLTEQYMMIRCFFVYYLLSY